MVAVLDVVYGVSVSAVVNGDDISEFDRIRLLLMYRL